MWIKIASAILARIIALRIPRITSGVGRKPHSGLVRRGLIATRTEIQIYISSPFSWQYCDQKVLILRFSGMNGGNDSMRFDSALRLSLQQSSFHQALTTRHGAKRGDTQVIACPNDCFLHKTTGHSEICIKQSPHHLRHALCNRGSAFFRCVLRPDVNAKIACQAVSYESR
jgi:hypothetical protein